MSKNTDLSELINYVKGVTSGRLTFPFYTSSTSFTGTVAGYLGFDSSGNILTVSGASQWITSGSNIYYNTGNVGIGLTNPIYALHVYNTTSAARITIQGTTNFVTTQHSNNSGEFYLGIDDSAGANFTGSGYARFLYSAGAYPMIFITNATQRMRITANGNLCVGTSTPHQGDLVPQRSLTIFGSNNSSIGLTNGLSGQKGTISYNDQQLTITNNSSTQGISVTALTQGVVLFPNGSSWTSASDESTKTDLIPIIDGLNKVVSLRALTGRYKTDKEGTSRAFLIAQDVQSVLPEAVTKDLENDKLMLSYTDVIPLLVASIKELKNELDILKANN